MKRIYIAGPMSGVLNHNRQSFDDHAKRLRALGWVVENPAEIGDRFGTLEEIGADPSLLKRVAAFEIETLKTCDALFLLAGWEFSAGTRAEIAAAIDADLPIYVQKIHDELPSPHDESPIEILDKTHAVHLEDKLYKFAVETANRKAAMSI